MACGTVPSPAWLARLLDRLRIAGPLTCPSFLDAAKHAALLISDSGGIQEEASVLKKPLLVLRRSTERPEALETFATLLHEPETLRDQAESLLAIPAEELRNLPAPFGDGHTSQRILDAITAFLTSFNGTNGKLPQPCAAMQRSGA